MGMVVRTNTMAMNAQRMMNINNNKVASSLQKLSSGYKINSAADDAAGLAISEHMKAQIKDLDAAADNSNDGISVAQTAEGALNEVHDMLNRMSELATKAANGVYTDSQRSNYSDEVTQLQSEIDRVADSTNFNGIKLLDGTQAGPAVTTTAADGTNAATTAIDFKGLTGANAIGGTVTVGDKTYEFVKTGGTATGTNTKVEVADNADDEAIASAFSTALNGGAPTGAASTASAASGSVVTVSTSDKTAGTAALAASSQNIGGMSLQIGDTNDSYNKLKVSISDMHASALGVDANSISISDQASAGKAISVINSAIDKVSKQRSQLGAIQNRLDHTINNLNTTSENLTSANSRIRDTDMAKEMMSYTQNNVLTQAAQAMLAQANQAPSQVLQLLK
ncbi:flagellin N-terminal helical domain-containing protein [Caproicibacterium argilliputei]|uniref:Flagellin n=1 Tax=Caproicibacterium argilliputei TaxID=3030016 RepID=A0AA97H277_9FIRM|nr:flagellin [Caproicibacterium argilliputei]WOC33253.1 flagellin [Caproicibacterium argilliputei]